MLDRSDEVQEEEDGDWTADVCEPHSQVGCEEESDDDSMDSAQWDMSAHAFQVDGEVRSKGVEEVGGVPVRAADTKQQREIIKGEGELSARVARGSEKAVFVEMTKKKGPEGAEKVSKSKKKKAGGSTTGADPLLLKKKNRLGQHARQKLAEQKFGKAAKHLQMMEERGQRQARSFL
jgi:hypothetical protein